MSGVTRRVTSLTLCDDAGNRIRWNAVDGDPAKLTIHDIRGVNQPLPLGSVRLFVDRPDAVLEGGGVCGGADPQR